MLRTTPLHPSIALDRNKATRAKQGECEEEIGKKKNCSCATEVFKLTTYKAPPVYIQNNHRTQVLTNRRWIVEVKDRCRY
jgi:hypothetical protein